MSSNTGGDDDNTSQDRKKDVPANPEARPTEAVEALESQQEPSAPEDEEAVPAEDVTENPDTDDMDDVPGPSRDEPNEPAG